MIVTVTANPSIDRTLVVAGALKAGGVYRVVEEMTQAGGKGINVALGVARAGHEVRALFPADVSDPFVSLVREAGLAYRACDLGAAVRTNLTLVDNTGVTTKVNEPGPVVGDCTASAFRSLVTQHMVPGSTLILSGSLMPGLGDDFYVSMIRLARERGVWVGVDTSDAPLVHIAQNLADAAPDFLKPNALELGQMVGVDGQQLERDAEAGVLEPAARAAHELHARGVGAVLLTLGAGGAILACPDGVFHARSPRVEVASTVGAGDSATAGYVSARAWGASHVDALAQASAYGTAAVTLPGTTIPHPDQVRDFLPRVRSL